MGWLGTHQNPCELNKPFRRKQLATHPFVNFAEACCGLMDPKQKYLSGDWGNGEMQQKFDQLRERQKKVGVFRERSSILEMFGASPDFGEKFGWKLEVDPFPVGEISKVLFRDLFRKNESFGDWWRFGGF